MKLDTYKRILFLDLRPALLEKIPLVKVKSLLLDLKGEQYHYQPLFEVEPERFVNARHEYYERVLNNASITFLNDFLTVLKASTNAVEKQYLINSALKQVSFYLLECYLWTSRPTNSISEAVVKPAMKHHLIRLYLEVSSEQMEEINERFIDEVYQRCFNEPTPVPTMIHEATIFVKSLEPKVSPVFSDSDFQIRMFDFRPEKKGILSFDTIIKNPKGFAEFEEHLFLYGFIDEDYNFTNKHGLKTEMAVKYHELINSGCFMPRNFKALKDIHARDIRKFLDHRYNVNLDKQFRILVNH